MKVLPRVGLALGLIAVASVLAHLSAALVSDPSLFAGIAVAIPLALAVAYGYLEKRI